MTEPSEVLKKTVKRTYNCRKIKIADVVPYLTNWKLIARILNKSSIRTWVKNETTKKSFSILLLDDSGEIRCTFFEDLCEQYYSKIEVDTIVEISNCYVKLSNQNVSNLNNKYELNASAGTNVEINEEVEAKLMKLSYDFLNINKIIEKKKDSIVDFIAIIKHVGEIESLVSKKNNEKLRKRNIELIDESGKIIILEVWEADVDKFNDTHIDAILTLKRAKIGEFQGIKNLSANNSTVFSFDYEGPSKEKLKTWLADSKSEVN